MTIQVRATTYRHKQGYVISGRPRGQVNGWPVSIFTETLSSARHIQAKVNRGEDIGGSDFEPQTGEATPVDFTAENVA